jgi:hypothetical protein
LGAREKKSRASCPFQRANWGGGRPRQQINCDFCPGRGHINLPGGWRAMPEPGSGLVLFCPAAAGACLYYPQLFRRVAAPRVLSFSRCYLCRCCRCFYYCRCSKQLFRRVVAPRVLGFSRCHRTLYSKPPPPDGAGGTEPGLRRSLWYSQGSSAICRPPSTYYDAGGPLQGVWK